MKKFLFVILISTSLFAQTNNKGKISLVYNEEKFDLPITQIVIRKENSIMVSVRAEKNDSLNQQMISLEFSLESMAEKVKIFSINDIRLSIFSRGKKDTNERKFTFNYGPKNAEVELYNGNERVNWSLPSLGFYIRNVEITHSSEDMTIKGSFSGEYRSTQQGTAPKVMVEIKDGKFEIIL